MIKHLIKKRLKDYKIQVVHIDKALSKKITGTKKVAVIGSGLAGISSACTLAERGFKVSVLEKNSYLGGKTGAWQHVFNDGHKVTIDHGFHAFFYQYYNLWGFLEKAGMKKNMAKIEEYLVLNKEKKRLTFKDVAKTPGINIVSLRNQGFYNFSDMMSRRMWKMAEFLNFSKETFTNYDHISFSQFCEQVQLPDSLRLVFNSFARAFFAEPEQMSMAELIKSFHFFYLSHDYGIDYDYFKGNYDDCFIEPVKKLFNNLNIEVALNKKIDKIDWTDKEVTINGKHYDYVVIAADVKGTKSIIEHNDRLKNHYPEYYDKLVKLKPANGYAVYKIWLKGKVDEKLPAFLITDREEVLDSVTFFNAFDDEAKAWAKEHNGIVVELHCYSVKPQFKDEIKLKAQFLNELFNYFPSLKNCDLVYEYFQMDNNFTSFHTQQYEHRPDYQSPIRNIKFAGDWVKLHIPAMLMEAAYSSGLFAANEILKQENLQCEPIYSVPLNGLLYGNPTKYAF